MDNADKITVVIPVRIDSPERKRNVDLLLRWINNTGMRIILLEADKTSLYRIDKKYLKTEYLFVEDLDSVFHRTRYLNQLLRMCTTPVVGICDSDVILPHCQIESSAKAILNEAYIMSIPYNGVVKKLSPQQSLSFEKEPNLSFLQTHESSFANLMGRPSCGGLFFVNREVYLQCGGENDHFYGWGPEDAERIRRMEILGYPLHWDKTGPLYHLWHPCGENSRFANENHAFINRKEFVKVCCMNRDELKKYTESWGGK